MAIVAVLVAQALPLAASRPATAATPPNIVVVMVDDMDARMVDYLPGLRSLMSERGLSFSSFYAAAPVCCPSRASFLRAQYPHNTGVLANEPPQGGLSAFRNSGIDQSTIATWLRGAGYRTALIGKYLNDYEKAPKHVAPGWNRWYVYAGGGKYTKYRISDQGKVRNFGKKNGKKKKIKKRQYQTDMLTRQAVDFINSTGDGQPLFLYLAPATPHEPATPAARHKKAAVAITQAPRLPSFNEADMSDKPGVWQRGQLDGRAIGNIDTLYVKQLRSMYAVEDMIGRVMAALEAKGRLGNTYILFTSDNGLHHGEHRVSSEKNTPFEESIRVPLIVVGPGVPAGVTTDAMTSMVDLGPTFAELAGIAPPGFVDGRSLLPVFDGTPPASWRDRAISELLRGVNGGFVVLRSGPYAYVEWGSGDRELYDLEQDPYQLDNIHGSAPPGLLDELRAEMAALRSCGSGGPATCQEVDGGG
jgi:arylsulfatase A-like enzyme